MEQETVTVSKVQEAVDVLRAKIRAYCQINPIDQKVPRKTCAELVQYLAHDPQSYLTLKGVTEDFDSKLQYPERPMIQLSGFSEDEPTIWLLGWRAGEETPIHDHANSEVGIQVFEGSVTEHIYVPHDLPKNPGEQSEFNIVKRELLEGSAVRITAPYVHVFTKTCEGHTCVHATTIHCYYPRLLTMNFFEVIKDSHDETPKLRYNGVWADRG